MAWGPLCATGERPNGIPAANRARSSAGPQRWAVVRPVVARTAAGPRSALSSPQDHGVLNWPVPRAGASESGRDRPDTGRAEVRFRPETVRVGRFRWVAAARTSPSSMGVRLPGVAIVPRASRNARGRTFRTHVRHPRRPGLERRRHLHAPSIRSPRLLASTYKASVTVRRGWVTSLARLAFVVAGRSVAGHSRAHGVKGAKTLISPEREPWAGVGSIARCSSPSPISPSSRS
jgi:hypothetical protein